MKQLIEITAQKNGAHRNRICFQDNVSVPDGWAVIADGLQTDHFPFGDVTVREIDGIMTVTSWNALPLPPVSEDWEKRVTASDILNVLLGEDYDEE